MGEQEKLTELLEFFKALAEENRLKIVGLLAQRSYSVEELAGALGLSVSTASHHLARLAKAGLVRARVEGHYYIYSLRTKTLHQMAQRLLQEEALPRLADDAALDAFDRKTLQSFLDAEGHIKAIPAQQKKYQVLLRYLVKAFAPGERYTEKQVNQIIEEYHPDTALLRRDLVDYGLMAREGGGKSYWRV